MALTAVGPNSKTVIGDVPPAPKPTVILPTKQEHKWVWYVVPAVAAALLIGHTWHVTR